MKDELIFSSCDTKRGIVGNPVAHHDASAWLGDPHHLLGDLEGLGREHRAEDGEREVEGVIVDACRSQASPSSNVSRWSPAWAARRRPASTRFLAISTPTTSAPLWAAGTAVVPSPQPRSSTCAAA